MKALNGILSDLTKTITKLDRLASINITTVEENTDRIDALQQQNLSLTAEAQAARNIAANLLKLIENETGEIK
ncbi:MAG: hypothetical protein WC096_08405 [Sphaerochaetaceae bacterium]